MMINPCCESESKNLYRNKIRYKNPIIKIKPKEIKP